MYLYFSSGDQVVSSLLGNCIVLTHCPGTLWTVKPWPCSVFVRNCICPCVYIFVDLHCKTVCICIFMFCVFVFRVYLFCVLCIYHVFISQGHSSQDSLNCKLLALSCVSVSGRIFMITLYYTLVVCVCLFMCVCLCVCIFVYLRWTVCIGPLPAAPIRAKSAKILPTNI